MPARRRFREITGKYRGDIDSGAQLARAQERAEGGAEELHLNRVAVHPHLARVRARVGFGFGFAFRFGFRFGLGLGLGLGLG